MSSEISPFRRAGRGSRIIRQVAVTFATAAEPECNPSLCIAPLVADYLRASLRCWCGKELLQTPDLEKEAHVDDRLGAGAGAMPSTKQCVPSVQVFNITASVPRRAWAATLSLDALALERQPVIVTGLPIIQHWPALTGWSDLCAHAPHLGRVFSGTGRVFYHDNREKPFAMHQA